MNHQLDRALRFVVFFTLTLLVAGSIQVASAQSTVEVRPTVVRGVRIVSAELAPDSTSSPQTVVVTLRNDGAASGQMVLLTTLVHDSEGRVKGGGRSPSRSILRPEANRSLVIRSIYSTSMRVTSSR